LPEHSPHKGTEKQLHTLLQMLKRRATPIPSTTFSTAVRPEGA
jgi:hypothetical protein